MDNTVIVAIYAPFAVVTAGIFFIDLFRRFNRRDHQYFMLLCLCVVGWFISRILGILAGSAEQAEFFIGFSVIFIGLMPPFLFLTVYAFYRVPLKRPRLTTALLFVIPAVNSVMALTARRHALMFSRLEIVSLAPVREVIVAWGPGFWVHTFYSYIIVMVIIGSILVFHRRIPKFYRMPSTLIIISLLITLAGNLVTLSQVLPLTMDPTLIAMSIALCFFELAIFSNSNSKFVRFSRGQVFQYIHDYILILDEKSCVVDYNNLALNWFTERGIVLDTVPFADVMQALLSSENALKKDLEAEGSSDIYLSDGIFSLVLNLHVEEMADARGDKIGSIATFTDVTQNRLLIERLEARAGMDSLTGLSNRRTFESAKARFDSPAFYPLSVIVCDTNGLKDVNDTYGHKYGDMMLQTIADVLDRLCPNQGLLARVGGDEFIFMLPATLPEDTEILMEKIRDALAENGKTPFKLSVALGAATKYTAAESLNDVIAVADMRMYEDKKTQKNEPVLLPLRA